MQISLLKPWQWIHRVPRAVKRESAELFRRIWSSRQTLWAVTLVDFKKRYSGSMLGLLWYPLYSALYLAVYSFVFMVVVRGDRGKYTPYEYVILIFAGLIPYLGFSEAIATGTSSIKSNISLIKNTIFPAELIPIKHVLVSILGLSVSMGILLLMLAPTRFLDFHLLYLPVPLILLVLCTCSATWILSALAVLIPDTMYMVNLLLLLIMFMSPIGYQITDLQGNFVLVALANPMTYLIDSFRFALIGERFTPMWSDAVFGAAAIFAVCLSGSFFRRLMPIFSDYE